MKRQKTPSFWAMLKNSFFWRFLHENGLKRNPIHTAETHSSSYDTKASINTCLLVERFEIPIHLSACVTILFTDNDQIHLSHLLIFRRS